MPLIEQESKKQNKNSKGPVVKQFEWFQMETRVRKIIQQIIDPIQLQIVKSSTQIQKLHQNDQTFHDKIQYMLKMTTNDPQVFEKGVFKKIQDRFQSQQKTLTFLQQQVKNNTSFINNKINLIDERMKESNDMIMQIQQLKKSNRENLQKQIENFQKVRKNIESNVQKMSSAIQNNQKTSGQKIQRLQKQVALNLIKMENIDKEFTQVKKYFESQKSINDDLIAASIKQKQQNRDFDKKFQEVNKKIKQFSKIKPFLQEVQIQCKKMLFKIDNICPLINEAQINESLYKILPQKFHPRIAVYEFQRYLQLNEQVLSRKFQSDPTSIDFNGQKLIRQSQQRNTKFLTKLKRSYYKNMGVDLDFISFQQRQRLLNDFDYAKLCQIVDELQELQNQKNDRRKNHRLTEEDIIKIVNRQIQKDKKFLIQKVHTQMKDSKTYLQNASDELHKIFQNMESKFQKITTNMQSNLTNCQLSLNNLTQIVDEINPKTNLNEQKINLLYPMNVQFCNYLQKSNKILKQLDSRSSKQSTQQINLKDKIKSYSQFNYRKSSSHDLKQNNHKKYQIGKMIKENGAFMSDSQNMSDSNKIYQKQEKLIHDSNPCEQNAVESQFDHSIGKIQQLLESYKNLSQQFKVKAKNISVQKFQNSWSKLTKVSQNQHKYRSHNSFNIKSHQKRFQNENKDQQSDLSTKVFLNIPSFKQQNSTKYCRQAFTTRLSMRKKSCITPSKSLFLNSQQKTQQNSRNQLVTPLKYSNKEVRDSISYFSELKKQNTRYLK